MKFFLTILLTAFTCNSFGQQTEKELTQFRLPAAILEPENQFSGMFIHRQKLFLLAESRVQQGHEARLYSIPLKDLEKQLQDSQQNLSCQKIPMMGLQTIQRQLMLQNQPFEGLEAATIWGETVYFSVETPTTASTCFIITGQLKNDTVFLDTTRLIPLRKPRQKDGQSIHNAGFESLLLHKNNLIAFYEFNLFSQGNFAYSIRPEMKPAAIDSIKMDPLPFRITDITQWKGKRYVGINYFYWHPEDKDYRPGIADPAAEALIKKDGVYKSYTRLVSLKVKAKKISWKPLVEFPEAYRPYNWEAIAAWNGGFLVMNDKYTPAKPYASTLIFIKPGAGL